MDDERPFPDAKALGLDLETTGLEFYGPHRIVLLTISDGNDVLTYQGEDLHLLSGEWFDRHVFDRIVVVHNAVFDLPWLDTVYGCGCPARIWDTMVCERLLTAGFGEPSNLASTAMRRLNVELSKDLQESFTEGGDAELTPEQIEYAERDAAVLVPIARAQHYALEEAGLGRVWEIEQLAAPVFAAMNRFGIRVDRDRLEDLIGQARGKMEAIECELADTLSPYIQPIRERTYQAQCAELDVWLAQLEAAKQAGNERAFRDENPRPKKRDLDLSPINLNSQQQMLAVFDALGLDFTNTQKGTIAFSLVRDDIPDEIKNTVLKPFQEYREYGKRVQAFGDGLLERIQPNSRLYSTIQPIGTQSGRPMASEPNILQMPNDATFRSVFLPDEGHLMIVCDYSQMELRILAEFSQDPNLVQAFIDGKDLHTETAKLIYGVDNPTDTQRKAAKSVSLGVPYGTSAIGIQMQMQELGIDMPRYEAQHVIDRWKEVLYPVAWARLAAWQEQAINLSYTETAFGRRCNFPKPKDGRQIGAVKRAGGNHPMQGCVVGDTRILTQEYGLIEIEQLVGNVVTVWDGEQWASATIVDSGIKQLWRVELMGGHVIECSPNHLFLVRSAKGNTRWVRADELTTNHRVVLTEEVPDWCGGVEFPWVREQTIWNGKNTKLQDIADYEHLGEFLGRVASDGGLSEGYVSLLVAEHELPVLARLQEITKAFGFVNHVVRKPSGTRKQHVHKLTICSRTLTEQLHDIGIKSQLPSLAWGRKDLLCAYLRGLFDGDGHVSVDGVHLTFGQGDKHLRWARQVQDALLYLGIQSRVRCYPENRIEVQVMKRSVAKFAHVIGFMNPTKQSQAEEIVSLRGPHGEVFGHSRRVRTVKGVGCEVPMFDAVNATNKRFSANGVVVHNTNADITKIAMAMVDQKLAQVGGRVCLNVYDELVCSVPSDYAEWGAMVVQTCMEEAARMFLKVVPVAVDCKISSSWAESEMVEGYVV